MSSSSIQASLRTQLWTFWQPGQRSGIARSSGKDSSTILSVLKPVRTAVPRVGHRIRMSPIATFGPAHGPRAQPLSRSLWVIGKTQRRNRTLPSNRRANWGNWANGAKPDAGRALGAFG